MVQCKIQRENFSTGPTSDMPNVSLHSVPAYHDGDFFGTGVSKLATNNVIVLLDGTYFDKDFMRNRTQ